VVAAALGLLVVDTEDQRLQWAGPGGVIGYESPHGGPLLQPALDGLKAEARATPEGRNPGWELAGGEDGFSSRGLTGVFTTKDERVEIRRVVQPQPEVRRYRAE
jgi:hypothetical protein